MKSRFTLLLVVLAFAVGGCGQGFQAASDLNGVERCEDNFMCAAPEDGKPEVELEGEVSAGPFGTFQAAELDKVNNYVIIRSPLPFNPGVGAIEGDLREIPRGKWTISQGSGGMSELALYIPVEFIVKGTRFIPEDRLPNGNPLPGFPGGEAPKIGLNIVRGSVDVSLYMSVEAVGFFLPTPGFNPFLNLTFPIKNKSGRKVVGYFSTVAERSIYDGGFFMSVRLPDGLARLIDNF